MTANGRSNPNPSTYGSLTAGFRLGENSGNCVPTRRPRSATSATRGRRVNRAHGRTPPCSDFTGVSMTLAMEHRLDRLRARLAELLQWRVVETMRIGGWSCDGPPIEVGAPWPRPKAFATSPRAPRRRRTGRWRRRGSSLDSAARASSTLTYADGAREFRARPQPRGISASRPRVAPSRRRASARAPFGQPVRRRRWRARNCSGSMRHVAALHRCC